VLSLTQILAFGDSLTEGTVSPARTVGALTAATPASYPFKLQTLIAARYTSQSIVVRQGGFAGKRASEDRGRFNDALSEARPELVLLMHGANDLASLAGLTAAQIEAGVDRTTSAVEDMVRDATGRGMRVMLATLPPEIGPPRGSFAPNLGKYNAQLKAMAAKKGAQIVDVNAQLPASLVGQDGLHLTEAGYQRVAEIFMDAISRTYEVTSQAAAR
jgi:lysophospholipase L1-like esterase